MRRSYYPDPRDNPKWKSMSADERAANAQQHIQEALASVVKLFESGDVPAAVQKMSFPPANIPMAHWSLGNRLICWMHGTMDARGFKQWQEVGRSVKKGARAFYILRPKLVKDKDDIDEETGEEKSKFVGTVPVAVFRVEDTDGTPVDYGLPEMPAHTFLDVAASWGIDVGLTPGGGGAYGWYSPGSKAIRLATVDESTFMHELAHAADDRLQGGLQVGQDPVQEICAELSAAALCLLVGLEDKGYNPGRSFEYISSYAQKLYPDAPAREAVAKACSRVVARVGKIMGLIIDTATGGARKNPKASTSLDAAARHLAQASHVLPEATDAAEELGVHDDLMDAEGQIVGAEARVRELAEYARERGNPVHGYQDEDTSGDAAIRQAAKHLEKLMLSGASAAEIREASAKYRALRGNPALSYPKIQRSDIESEHPTGRPSVGSLVWVQDLGDAVVAGYYRHDVVVYPTGDSPLADEGGYFAVPRRAVKRVQE